MADDHTQQTRVLLVNGQTIILQGDAGDNSINEINADLLQQALQEVSASAEDVDDGNENDYSAALSEPDTDSDNLVAIFHGSQSDGQTIQLTVQQAEALGIHFSVDEDGKAIHQQDIPHDVPDSIHIGDSRDHLVYSENTLAHSDNFQDCVSDSTCQNLKTDQDDEEHQLQTSVEGMETLPSDVSAFIGTNANQNITLIPQFVDGQISYTVKLNENQGENNVLEDSHFDALDEDTKSGIALIETPPAAVAAATTTISPTSSSALNLNGITSGLNISVSSVPSSQAVQLDNYQCSRTSGTNITATDKKQKVSYVLLPSNSTSGNSILSTKLTSSQGTRLTETFHALSRNQLLSGNTVITSSSQNKNSLIAAPSTGTTTQIGTVNALGGVPIVSPSPSIIRTSSNSLVSSSVSTTLTGGGMIRVVAGGGSNRIVQSGASSGSKLSSILAPIASNKLVTTTNSSTGQKIVSFNSANKVASSATTDAVSNAVSAALTRMPVPNFNSTKPLGSSENPIQLVQHGQTFHSVQSLSQEQLRQIATVLQQQHLESAPRTKNVLYDAETNTRIIYRVVYPEDLDLREPKSPAENKLGTLNSGTGRGRGRRGRPPKSSLRGGHGRGSIDSSLPGRKPGGSVDLDLDEDRLLDDTSKGEKKKQVARTRSGRLSRPPRHMVKDYKRLHHLDFADADLDDSDGGYSDYQMSDHEAEEVAEKATPKELLPGLVVPKRKISSHFRCPTCQKIYLGHSRMARHFEQYPDHGSIEQLQVPNQNNNNNNNTNSSNNLTTTTIANTAADSAVTPPSPVDQPGTPDIHDDKFTSIGTSHPNGVMRSGPARRRGKRRGPWSYLSPEIRSERRKVKLREVIGACEADELSEVAGPAVAGLLSLWDLLLLRVEAVRAEESYIATLCDQLRLLLEKVRAVVSDILRPMDSKCNGCDDQFELQDEMLCSTLGVACGRYWVDDRKLRYRKYNSNKDFTEPITKRSRLDGTPRDEPTENSGKVSCPEVLSALALDATANIKSAAAAAAATAVAVTAENGRSSPTEAKDMSEDSVEVTVSVKSEIPDKCSAEQDEEVEDEEEEEEVDHHEFLLNNASDMCVDDLAQSAGDKQDLQTVDDLVNERLKNLTGFSNSCETVAELSKDDNVVVHENATAASHVQASELINSLERFDNSLRQESVTSNRVPAFDPEIALAAMGEGEQEGSTEPTQFSTCLDGASASFDPEIALAAMGEGEQPVSNASSPHDSFQSSLPVIQSVRGNVGSAPFTPEMALAAMGEGDQSPVKTVCSPFQSSLPQLDSDVTSSFNNTMDITAIASSDRSEMHNQFSSLSQPNNVTASNQNSFDADITLAVIEDHKQTTDNNKTTTSQFSSAISNTFSTALSRGTSPTVVSSVDPVVSFDPEIALAAMGEGDVVVDSTPTEHSHMHFEASLPTNSETTSNPPADTFDPEMALAAMGEGPADVSSTAQFSQQSRGSVVSVEQTLVNSGTFQLTGLSDSAMDVSLDGSGPDLDFEALSEEFSCNTRHS